MKLEKTCSSLLLRHTHGPQPISSSWTTSQKALGNHCRVGGLWPRQRNGFAEASLPGSARAEWEQNCVSDSHSVSCVSVPSQNNSRGSFPQTHRTQPHSC